MKSSQSLKQAQTLLDNLTVENQAALQKRQQIRLDTETETKKLLEERKVELKNLESNALSALKPLQVDQTALEGVIRTLNGKVQSLESEIVGKDAEINAQNDLLGSIKAEIHESKSQLQVVQASNQGAQAQIDGLQAKISDSQAKLGEFKAEIDTLTTTKIGLVDFIERSTQEFEAQKIESERELNMLTNTINSLKGQIADSQSEWDLERQNLATRAQAVKEREDAVENRERKVKRDEDINARNYNLMNM